MISFNLCDYDVSATFLNCLIFLLHSQAAWFDIYLFRKIKFSVIKCIKHLNILIHQTLLWSWQQGNNVSTSTFERESQHNFFSIEFYCDVENLAPVDLNG